ncbi:MAG TPA: hypothetical protein VFS26_04745, partial [Solirubrobacterales bacterium]|nr:hypothetical protein [Solirubrobacterales bacterium]
VRWARSATKHRISRQRSGYVVEHCGLQFVELDWRQNRTRADVRVVFLGDDLEAVPLEVIAVETEEDDFLVIHAMKMRNRFATLYEEARRWRS